MAFTAKFSMTAKGQSKLTGIKKALRQGALQAAIEGATTLRALAASRAPTWSEEAQLVSQGVAYGAGQHGGGVVGIAAGGHHFPEGIGIRAAMENDPIVPVVTPFGASASTGVPAQINPAAEFSWHTTTRGTVGPTKPFNNHLLEALEDGGTWTVTPRTVNLLAPEPGVTASGMLKTIQPRGMYRKAAIAWGGSQISHAAVTKLKAAVSTVGLS